MRMLWYGSWRDEVVEFGNCNGGTKVIGGDKKTKGTAAFQWRRVTRRRCLQRGSLWFLLLIGR